MSRVALVGDLAEQIRGVSYAKSDASAEPRDGFLPVLRAGNIDDGTLIFDDLVYVPAERVSEKQKIRENDVVIAASSGSLSVVGKAARARTNFEGGFGAFCKVLRPRKDVDPGYFGHFFQTPKYRWRISQLAAGANINNLRNGDLDGLEIPLPPLSEQKRIAAILDKADALRTKRQATLTKLDELTQSIFLEMFGDPVTNPKEWPVKPYSSVCSRITVGVVVKPASYYRPTGIPALRSLNISPDEIVLDDLVFFDPEESATTLQKTVLRSGDIILIRSGQPGTAAVVPKSLDGVNAIDILISSPMPNKCHPGFISAFFNSAAGHRIALSAQRGQIQKHLNVGSLKKVPVPLPPLDLQCEYALRLDTISALNKKKIESQVYLDTLFASLQHRAFSGTL